jgi:uncharacterized glyoxalase superfamily protein PhnB
MDAAAKAQTNVKRVVPFFRVVSMEKSLPYYLEGLGFTMKHRWEPGGKIRWCWLGLGGAALMLQEWHPSSAPSEKVGVGVSLCFTCEDALAIYRDLEARGLNPSEPEVGNHMWVTDVTDPDGYRLFFESPTDVPEETKLSELK